MSRWHLPLFSAVFRDRMEHFQAGQRPEKASQTIRLPSLPIYRTTACTYWQLGKATPGCLLVRTGWGWLEESGDVLRSCRIAYTSATHPERRETSQRHRSNTSYNPIERPLGERKGHDSVPGVGTPGQTTSHLIFFATVVMFPGLRSVNRVP